MAWYWILVDEGIELGIGLFDAAAGDDAVLHVGGEGLFERTAGDADDGELLGKKAGLLEVIERGQELALGEVAGGAEDDDDAGVGHALGLLRGWRVKCRRFDFWDCHLDPPAFFFRTSLRLLDGMAAELIAHDGEHAVGEVVFFARAQAADEATR